MSTTRRRGPTRGGLLPAALACLLIAAAAALGIWVQFGERQTQDTVYAVGGSPPDRVDVGASVQRVDAAGRELVLRVLVTPRGRLAEAGGVSPTEDLTLQTSPSTRGDLSFPAHSRIATKDLAVALTGGSITDYPFDAYDAAIEFTAVQGGEQVPVRVTLTNGDALFSAAVDATEGNGTAYYAVALGRSDSVLVFAVFMMVAMWALAVAVFLGAWFLVTRRKGLTWPALGWMAATLFALAAFRNTAPGTPPIGSLLDYLAFLWAETVIACCLVTVAVTGFRAERHTRDTPGSPGTPMPPGTP
ncbi:DUF4436 family protein [Streptomyces sp. NPDC051771]|uniref:DUF4436 family protein n=1 Tax=Streptomyces sp. NPDC051771 TaxID=3154847 RepID=UPI0034138C8A